MNALLQAILAAVKTDALKVALPIIQQFFSDVAANPSQSNIVAKLAKLQVDLMAALPDLQAAVAKDLATILEAEINTLVAAKA